MITAYLVIERNQLYALNVLVGEMIANGYQPLGGVSQTTVGVGCINYAQALVKTQEAALEPQL